MTVSSPNFCYLQKVQSILLVKSSPIFAISYDLSWELYQYEYILDLVIVWKESSFKFLCFSISYLLFLLSHALLHSCFPSLSSPGFSSLLFDAIQNLSCSSVIYFQLSLFAIPCTFLTPQQTHSRLSRLSIIFLQSGLAKITSKMIPSILTFLTVSLPTSEVVTQPLIPPSRIYLLSKSYVIGNIFYI